MVTETISVASFNLNNDDADDEVDDDDEETRY